MNDRELQNIKNRYGIIGRCADLNHALNTILQIAPTDLSVLVTGENGSGKDIVARIIHDNSKRKNKKFLAINCGAIPEGTINSELFGHEAGSFTGAIGEREGYFGATDGGTLFLDEVAELPLSTQAQLLRVLESHEYIRVGSDQVRKTDVRIVAATNVNIQKAITEGRFREDLFYRLNTIPVRIPPLRERGEDILLLFKKFALDMSEQYQLDKISLTEEAARRLLNYAFPGNVRELRNIVEYLSITSPSREITPEILNKRIPEDRESTELVAVNGKGPTSYTNERENILHALYSLGAEVKSIHETMSAHERILQKLSGNTVEVPAEGSGSIVQVRHEGLVPALVQTPREIKEVADDFLQDEQQEFSLAYVEKEAIKSSLVRNKWVRKETAKELGISEKTLSRRIKLYGLD